jgi:hypothetical protein
MQGLQRTCASALYTRLSVLPRFSFFVGIHLRSSISAESKQFFSSQHGTHRRTAPNKTAIERSLFCQQSLENRLKVWW